MYIGYGVDNASVHFDSGSADGEKFESDDPVGDCLVSTASDPKLYSVHDLKHDLVGSSAKRIITTLFTSFSQPEFLKMFEIFSFSTCI